MRFSLLSSSVRHLCIGVSSLLFLLGASAGVSAETVSSFGLTPSSLTMGRVGSSYSTSLMTGADMFAPYQWSIQSGSLPAGIVIDPVTGRLSGTPSMAGTSTFAVWVTDSLGRSATQSYTFVTQPALFQIYGASDLPPALLGVDYMVDLNAGNMSNAYTWSLLSGSLPQGITLNSNGTLRGMANSNGTWNFMVRAMNGMEVVAERALTLRVTTVDAMTATSTWQWTPTSTWPTPTTPTPSVTPTSADQVSLLQNLTRINLPVHSLVRMPLDASGVNNNLIYYIGTDGKRHPFIPDDAYSSWYTQTDNIRAISSSDLASIPLGAAVAYRPGWGVIRFETSPHLYVVQRDGTLRRLMDDTVAANIYGVDWRARLRTIPVAFYDAYRIMPNAVDVSSINDYNSQWVQADLQYPSQAMSMMADMR